MNDQDQASAFPSLSVLSEHSAEVWRSTSSSFPHLGRRYSRREQQEREELIDRCIESIDLQLCSPPLAQTDVEEALACLTSGVVQLANVALDLENPLINSLLRDGFSRISIDLAHRARDLDPAVSMADILQACRNAWTACGLQLLLGKPMHLTPAIFAYSMLYPYSDNYLDDADVSDLAKLHFSVRFRHRLAGEHPAPADVREVIVSRLVGLIESQYPRAHYPQVYDALLAIHHAQQRSIRQMQPALGNGNFDVLALSVMKGGTSVLADAYLAAGTLSKSEAQFAFEWGVLLQLSDDLQDVREDRGRGAQTLFSQAACRKPLDSLTNQAFHLSQTVMSRMPMLPNGSEILQQLLARSSRTLLMRSAANAPELYTSSYLSRLEAHSPVGFAFLRSRERRFADRSRTYSCLFNRFLTLDVLPFAIRQ